MEPTTKQQNTENSNDKNNMDFLEEHMWWDFEEEDQVWFSGESLG